MQARSSSHEFMKTIFVKDPRGGDEAHWTSDKRVLAQRADGLMAIVKT